MELRNCIKIIVILLSLTALASSLNCSAPGVSLYSNVTTVSNGQQLVSGNAVICVNGWLFPLCDEDNSIASDDINLVCSSMGFDGGSVLSPNSSLYGSLNQSSYSNLTCPVNAADTRNCTAVLSTNPLCMNGSKDLVIQCSRPLTMTSTIMATTMTTASSSTTVTAITTSTSSSRIATSTSPTPSTTSNAPSSTLNIRLIVSIATGGAVFVLTVLVVVAVLIIVTCLCIRNARRKSRRERSQKPVELKGYND